MVRAGYWIHLCGPDSTPDQQLLKILLERRIEELTKGNRSRLVWFLEIDKGYTIQVTVCTPDEV
jgi:hypothetical protein